jgi:hypothetical protein
MVCLPHWEPEHPLASNNPIRNCQGGSAGELLVQREWPLPEPR